MQNDLFFCVLQIALPSSYCDLDDFHKLQCVSITMNNCTNNLTLLYCEKFYQRYCFGNSRKFYRGVKVAFLNNLPRVQEFLKNHQKNICPENFAYYAMIGAARRGDMGQIMKYETFLLKTEYYQNIVISAAYGNHISLVKYLAKYLSRRIWSYAISGALKNKDSSNDFISFCYRKWKSEILSMMPTERIPLIRIILKGTCCSMRTDWIEKLLKKNYLLSSRYGYLESYGDTIQVLVQNLLIKQGTKGLAWLWLDVKEQSWNSDGSKKSRDLLISKQDFWEGVFWGSAQIYNNCDDHLFNLSIEKTRHDPLLAITYNAARYGKIDILEQCCEKGINFAIQIVKHAASGARLECLKFCDNHGASDWYGAISVLKNEAKRPPDPDCLRYCQGKITQMHTLFIKSPLFYPKLDTKQLAIKLQHFKKNDRILAHYKPNSIIYTIENLCESIISLSNEQNMLIDTEVVRQGMETINYIFRYLDV